MTYTRVIPNVVGKETCTECLGEEGSKFTPLRKDCKHKMVPREVWLGLSAMDTFDVKSTAQARRLFGECCQDAKHYVAVRKLTDEEILKLRSGKRKITIALVDA